MYGKQNLRTDAHLDRVPNHRRVVVDVAAQLDLHQVPGLQRLLLAKSADEIKANIRRTAPIEL